MGEGMSFLTLDNGLSRAVALLVAVNQLPVLRLGRRRRASPRAWCALINFSK
jgi:hypothetical protein